MFDTVSHTLNLNGGTISGITDPILGNDAANKNYVDNMIRGLNMKEAAFAATVGNVDLTIALSVITLANKLVSIVDDVPVVPGYRVLLMNQTNQVENGIYVVQSDFFLIRSLDFAANDHVAGVFVYVESGTVYGDKGMDANQTVHIILDEFSGMSYNGNYLRIDSSLAGSGLLFNNGVLTTDPVIKSGSIWEGNTVALGYGGTGSTTFVTNGIVYSNGTKLTSSTDFVWDPVSSKLGLGGPVNPYNQNDGITLYSGDIVAQQGGLLIGNNASNYNWNFQSQTGTPLSSISDLPNEPWELIAFSKNGKVGVLLTDPSYSDYVSINGGWNWNPIIVNNISLTDITWSNIVVSANGTTVVICGLNDHIYYSSNSGVSFTASSIAENSVPNTSNLDWKYLSMSDSGQYIIAVTNSNGVYLSTNYGILFSLIDVGLANNENITMVHVNKNGDRTFIGCTNSDGTTGGHFLVSTDLTFTFNTVSSIRNGLFTGVAESSLSNVIIVFENPGSLFLSSDSGDSWTELFSDTEREWISASISSNGTTIAAAAHSGLVFVSTDSGSTFSSVFNNTVALWTFVKIASDDLGLLAGGSSMPVYVSKNLGTTSTTVTANVNVPNACLIPDYNSLFFPDRNGSVYRYTYSPFTNLVISSGNDPVKSNLTDLIVVSELGHMGVGFTQSTSFLIEHTLDISGTLRVSESVHFKQPLSLASGGTGVNDLDYGLVIANGTQPFTSTLALQSGAVPIGKSDGSGKIVIESGGTLRSHLGLGIGTHVQAWNSNLDTLSSLTPESGAFVVGNGTGFTLESASTVLELLGVGTVAMADTINNTNWSGSQLSVENGGTGSTTFTSGSLSYYTGSVFASTNVKFDSVNNGIAINNNSVIPGSGISVYNSDISIVPSDNTNSSSFIFYTSAGLPVFRLRRSDSGTGTGDASFIISGGTVNSNITGLIDQFSISPNGKVSVLSTIDSISGSTGALVVSGGIGVTKNATVAGKLTVTNTTDASSVSLAAVVINGGLGIQKGIAIGGNASLAGTLVVLDTLDATSYYNASVAITGGLAIQGKIWNKKGIVIETGNSVSTGVQASGLTVSVDAASYTKDTAFTKSSR
ncbi:hypothetical protein HDU81_008231, partial [Chytriomyces hyalinus]